MKKFRFRLERVLQYRETVKGERRRELLEANAVLHAEQAKLEHLEASARETHMPEGIVDIAAMSLLGYLAVGLHERILFQRGEVASAEAKAEERRVAYVEAAREAETLARLKTQRSVEHTARVRQLEDKANDEISVQRFTREILIRRRHESEKNRTHA